MRLEAEIKTDMMLGDIGPDTMLGNTWPDTIFRRHRA